jgi:hypothetical protein
MSKLLIYLTLGLVLISYQNCSKAVNFSKSASGNAYLAPIDNGDNIADGGIDQNGGDDIEQPGDTEDNNDVITDDNDDSNDVSSATEFICILAGSGQSQKLGLVDGDLVSKNATPSTVCTTEEACFTIASQKFEVISAKRTGYCKNGKAHSIALSAEELLDLVNK